MASQTAPIVYRTIMHQMDTSLEEDELIQKTFERRVCVRSCDLHPSATAAERALRHSRCCKSVAKGFAFFSPSTNFIVFFWRLGQPIPQGRRFLVYRRHCLDAACIEHVPAN